MQSRSYLLIEKELEKVKKANVWGIEVSLIDDNIYNWAVQICGPKETLWEGGVFQVYIKFDEHFHSRPPMVCFHTIPYHPNIDMITGVPCIDYTDNWSKWQTNYKIYMMLLQIQNMLQNPVLDNAVNPEAVSLMIGSPQAYQKIVNECVATSQSIAEGNLQIGLSKRYSLPDMRSKENEQIKSEPQTALTLNKTTKLSFGDYLLQWNGIATTKCRPEVINSYSEMLKNNKLQKRIHCGISDEDLEEEDLNKQEEYDSLYYGPLQQTRNKTTVNSEPSKRDKKLARINQMKKIYLPKKGPASTPRSPLPFTEPELKEVDDLVAWTKNLNADDLTYDAI